MRVLLLRLLGASLAALVVIQLLAGTWAAFRVDHRQLEARAELLDDKLLWASERLNELPPTEWERELHRLRPSLALPLEVLPPEAPLHPHQRGVRLANGAQLVAFPGGPPGPPLGGVAGQVLLSVLVFGAVLIWLGRPLFRDLSTLERASRRIAEGDLGARAGLSEGPAADLGSQFDAMAERVEVLVEGQKQLLAAVSHEIRTPLARMRFQIESLRAIAGDAPVEPLDVELDAIDALLGELLEMARMDQPPLEPAEPEATVEVIESLCARMQGLAEVSLELDLEGGLPIGRKDLARIVENLVSNAQRHARSTVRLVLREGCLVVEDDGAGIPPADRARVFEPFHSGDPSRNRELGGVGLGLALVARAADRWGAHLEVTGSPLGGARFELRWS